MNKLSAEGNEREADDLKERLYFPANLFHLRTYNGTRALVALLFCLAFLYFLAKVLQLLIGPAPLLSHVPIAGPWYELFHDAYVLSPRLAVLICAYWLLWLTFRRQGKK
jgi:hypothetical protein